MVRGSARALRRGGGVPGLLLLLLLLLLPAAAPGCASTGGEAGEGEVVVRKSGLFAHLLPEPVGDVTFTDDPVVFSLGWIGMVAGGVGAGWLMAEQWWPDPPTYDGEALGVVFVGGVLLGAVVGGCLLTAPVRALEALFRWAFG